jgi:hypothetical protein
MNWLSKFFSKGKKEEENKRSFSEMLDFISPIKDLNPENEEEMLDWVAKHIIRYGMQTPAILFLESVKPFAYIGGQLSLVFVAPFLEFIDVRLAGMEGYDWSTLFSKKENIDLLVKKIKLSSN